MDSAEKNIRKISKADVLIITAVEDEFSVIKGLENNWQKKSDSSGYSYYIKEIKNAGGDGFVIALASANEMASVYAANLATRLITELRPRCIAMIGVCAGWKEKVFLGDVIVAERVYRCDTGKLQIYLNQKGIRTEDVFQDIKTYNLKELWKHKIKELDDGWKNDIQEKRPLSFTYQEQWLLYAIHSFEKNEGEDPKDRNDRQINCPNWSNIIEQLEKKDLIEFDPGMKLTDNGNKWIVKHKIQHGRPKSDPKTINIKIAPMATGPDVREDSNLFTNLCRSVRKVEAYDMEGAAIGAVASIEDVPCIIAKGVSDYGDLEKGDHFRKYAIEASYRFLVAFLREIFPSLLESDREILSERFRENTLNVDKSFEHGRKFGHLEIENKLLSTESLEGVSIEEIKKILNGIRNKGSVQTLEQSPVSIPSISQSTLIRSVTADDEESISANMFSEKGQVFLKEINKYKMIYEYNEVFKIAAQLENWLLNNKNKINNQLLIRLYEELADVELIKTKIEKKKGEPLNTSKIRFFICKAKKAKDEQKE